MVITDEDVVFEVGGRLKPLSKCSFKSSNLKAIKTDDVTTSPKSATWVLEYNIFYASAIKTRQLICHLCRISNKGCNVAIPENKEVKFLLASLNY